MSNVQWRGRNIAKALVEQQLKGVVACLQQLSWTVGTLWMKCGDIVAGFQKLQADDFDYMNINARGLERLAELTDARMILPTKQTPIAGTGEASERSSNALQSHQHLRKASFRNISKPRIYDRLLVRVSPCHVHSVLAKHAVSQSHIFRIGSQVCWKFCLKESKRLGEYAITILSGQSRQFFNQFGRIGDMFGNLEANYEVKLP